MEGRLDDDGEHFWQLCWRAAAGRDFLSGPKLIEQIKHRLLGAHRLANRELLYYLLLHDEIHMISRLQPGDSPRALAFGLASVVAKRVRESQESVGPVFAARYFAQRIDSIDELGNEIRMLGWRPFATGFRLGPTYYQHSALPSILGTGSPDAIDWSELLLLFEKTVPLARSKLRKLLAKRPSQPEIVQWELDHELALARGAMGPFGPMARHVRGAAAILVAASEPQGVDGALLLIERWVSQKLKLRVPPSRLERSDRRGPRARALVAIVAARLGLCSAVAVARYFGRSKSTLSEHMTAFNACAENLEFLSIPQDRIVREAIELAAAAASRGAAQKD